MASFDLTELDRLVGSGHILSDHPSAAVSFPRDVHLRSERGKLDNRVRDFVERQTGKRPTGKIHLLTQLRYFGVYFSPLNLYLVEDQEDAFPRQIVAEVNNIPWGEQHAYLLTPTWDQLQQAWTYEHPKQMHVSPFMPMNQLYRWTFRKPQEQLVVGLENWQDGRRVFQAGMSLEKRPLTTATLRRFSWNMPAISLKVVAAIYLEASKLWWKRCPIFPHP